MRNQAAHPAQHRAPAAAPGVPAGQRFAAVIADALSPPAVCAATIVYAAARGAESPAVALRWALVALLFCAAIPVLILLVGVRRGALADRHVSRREQRPVPLSLAALSAMLGLGLLAAFHAPLELVAAVAGLVVTYLTASLLTLWWKVSFHTAAIASLTVILLRASPLGIALLPVVVLVAWSRVRLRAHSVAQVVAGGLLGGVVTLVVLSLIR